MKAILNFFKKYWFWILSLIYILWPIDLIADVFMPLGLIDDSALLISSIFYEIYRHNKKNKRADQQPVDPPRAFKNIIQGQTPDQT